MNDRGHDLPRQSNKAHKGVSQKIQKRRDKEKKKKQEKKVKELKGGKKNKESRTKKLDKYFAKLLRVCGDDISEVGGVFDALDNGAEIGLKEMENEKLAKILKKIFKLFELKKNTEKQYFKPQGYECLLTKFNGLAKRAKSQNNPEKGEDKGSDSDSASKNNSDDEKLHDSEDSENESIEDELVKKKLPPPVNVASSGATKTYGPTLPQASNAKPELVSEKLGQGLLDSLLAGKTYQSESREKLRQGLVGPKLSQKEVTPETDIEKQERLKKYFEEYDKQHRPKTLMEIHQEKKNAGVPKGREEFDREKLGYARVDSKNAFQIMGAAGKGLNSKFSDGKFMNTFI
jgi:hypothetical protein